MPSLTPGRFVGQTLDLRATSSQRGMPGRFVSSIGNTFLPTSLSGCQLWLDASATQTITSSSGKVSQWDDLSGNGRHVSQATGSLQPSTGTRTQNGRNAIEYTGSGLTAAQVLRRTSVTTSQPWSCVWVGKWDNVAISGGSVAISLRNGTGSYVTWTALSASGWNITDGTNRISTAAANTDAHVFARVADTTNTRSRLRVDGTEVIAPTTTGVNNGTEYIVGAYDSTGAYALDGYVCEIAMYDRNLSDAELRELELYLRAKWGI